MSKQRFLAFWAGYDVEEAFCEVCGAPAQYKDLVRNEQGLWVCRAHCSVEDEEYGLVGHVAYDDYNIGDALEALA